MSHQPPLCFDTSAINAFKLSPDRNALLAGIRSGYFTRLTFPSVAEPLATKDASVRGQLFDILNALRLNGECLQAHQWILPELAKNHQRYGSSRWDSLDIRFVQCEIELARRTFSEDESKEEREFAQKTEDQFTKIFTDASPHFKELFDEGTKRPTNADELLTHLNGEGGAFWTMAADLYKKAVGVSLTEEQVRTFVEDCPPFHALMLGLIHGQFEWSITATPSKKRKRVGRLDLFSAIYLPYCDIYVTNDDEQRKCLTQIAAALKLEMDIISFSDLGSRLMPLDFLAIGA